MYNLQPAIGGHVFAMRRPILRLHEAAFVLEVSEQEVRNMLRRGERLQRKEVPDADVAASGALPVSASGTRRRGIQPLMLALHPRVAGDPLREAALRGIAAGRLRAPKAVSAELAPPRVIDRLHAVYR